MSNKPDVTAAIIVAAGRGTRLGGNGAAKQYVDLAGQPMLRRVVTRFAQHRDISEIVVVIHAQDEELYASSLAGAREKLAPPVFGGATRQASVHAGLEALAGRAPDRVLIHDAARPLVSSSEIDSVIEALDHHSGAIVATPVVDTLKRAQRGSSERRIEGTVDRTRLWQAQTPQAFHYSKILAAHRKAAASGRSDFTDDASIAEAAGLDVVIVDGSARNFKITTQADLRRAAKELHDMSVDVRTGSGFDVHQFADGDHVWLCGVKIPHSKALTGHSDADVGLHALTDAIYGALAEGDIGAHFPPSDPQWAGAASSVFLTHACQRIADRGGTLTHVDVTLVCEAPKVGPHRDAMRGRLAELVGIEVDRVSVKATTTERLGFAGREEGIAAMASATIVFG